MMLGVNEGIYYGGVDPSIGMSSGVCEEVPGNTFLAQNPGDFQKIHSVLADGGDRFGVSAVTFDLQEELIWMGNQGGHVTSYYSANMEKYTSFQVINNQEIRHILTLDDIILILSQSQLRGQIRRGLPVFTHVSENLVDMQCMLQTTPTTVLLGGHQNSLVEFDLSQNAERGTVQIGDPGCAILRSQGHNRILVGQASGEIHLLDSRTYRKEQSIEAHGGSLSDFDVHGNMLVTCGFSSRHGSLTVDRFLKVYDLRVMRALAPIQVTIDPLMLRFLPSFSSRIATISPTGQMEILETQAVSSANILIYQVTSNSSMCLGFDVSSSCHHMIFGDSAGTLNLFSSNPSAMFNSYSRDTEFADPVEEYPFMGILDQSACFSSIPLPACNGSLSSEWPEHILQPAYRRAPEIDPAILQSMKMVGTIGYAPNPGKFRRNQMMYDRALDVKGGSKDNQTLSPPSSSYQSSPVRNPRHHSSPIPGRNYSKQPGRHFHGKFQIPKRYSKIDWKKTTFEPSDMESFNKTKFPGLEATTVNSYCNSMLQILYHINYIRGFLISHLCSKDFCLSCELGFLFHMLDQTKTLPCAASNFIRAFRVVPEASALGLIRQENQSKQRCAYFRLIQSWNRFILHQIEGETAKTTGKSDDNEGNFIEKLFGMKQKNMNRCTKCGREANKESTVLLSNLLYSLEATGNGQRCVFTEILQRSLYPEQTTPAWCDQCNKYFATFQSRAPKSLPRILSLNTCLDNAHDYATWKKYLESFLCEKRGNVNNPEKESMFIPPSLNQFVGGIKSCRYGSNCVRPDCKFWHEGRSVAMGTETSGTEFEINAENQVKWLPQKIRVTITDTGKVSVQDMDEVTDITPLPPGKDEEITEVDYELFSTVSFVKDPENDEKCNLVAAIHVDEEYFERFYQTSKRQGWFLFNDFSIKEIQASEAASFNPKWKIPAVVYYRQVNFTEIYKEYPMTRTVTADVFKQSTTKDHKKKITYEPLGLNEMPQKGELVPVDCEFVNCEFGVEETELRSDGKLSTVRPQQLSLARVTCLRSQGPNEGSPFIDDYISTQEVVVDYLTKFSGIKPGDLDANYSSKHVVGLKSVYLKLRFLIDAGVKFVGHGLSNDFRVMNLVVPPDQIIDTVHLFHLHNQRMVSLRFLAWFYLGMVIQSDTHDSIEDARSALALYRKHEELKESGQLEKSLEELYETGNKLQWKVNGVEK